MRRQIWATAAYLGYFVFVTSLFLPHYKGNRIVVYSYSKSMAKCCHLFNKMTLFPTIKKIQFLVNWSKEWFKINKIKTLKSPFSLVVNSFTPPPLLLVDCPLKKKNFFAASLTQTTDKKSRATTEMIGFTFHFAKLPICFYRWNFVILPLLQFRHFTKCVLFRKMSEWAKFRYFLIFRG